MRCYRDHIRLHLDPHLGHIPLDQLTVADFEAMFAAITERDNRTLAARNHPDPAVRGLRRGEAIGLREVDVDLMPGRLALCSRSLLSITPR
jgi:hypothetical protein